MDDSGPAFPGPRTRLVTKYSSAFPVEETVYVDGLTKREYFAVMAMQGFCLWDYKTDGTGLDWEKVASWAFKMAEAMLAEGRK